MKTFQEIQELNWSEYNIDDMHNYRFNIDVHSESDFNLFGKRIKGKLTLIPVNNLYELSKIFPRKEFIILSDSANSSRGYSWTEEMVKYGFNTDGEPNIEYFRKLFNNTVQDYMAYDRNTFMPCF